MTTTRTWLGIAAVALGACSCPEARVSNRAYADMTTYGLQITACIVDQSCAWLCREVFALDREARLDRCEVTQIDRAPAVAQGGVMSPGDLRLVRGVQVDVTYTHPQTCAFDVGFGGDGASDGWDDGSTDDGSDDGSDDGMDDGSTDDGSDDGMDDGSDDGGDDGDDGGDDGGGDDGGGDGRAPPPIHAVHAPTTARR